MTLTEDGRPARTSVLLPAAGPGTPEHWAQRAYGALTPLPDTAEDSRPDARSTARNAVHAHGTCTQTASV
ncbi:hypothetical protein OHA61_39750 [Streptomyces sp. NBC_00885]|uniref:hypothetical protein n=1 Tax=Streptomyces sp. NBC_00885 TaxID=2975857 RepID=UPI00386DB668|nr:hypothetical protein OHA61_00055 [Streptomyces sp. NBC_00885]WSY72141.1 hypothetical protein OHA61_39750 [Streptomyces sp. NBC_00885]